ncbi:MAG: amino acid adenylation domain-containing protein [Stenotrophomonas sp.]
MVTADEMAQPINAFLDAAAALGVRFRLEDGRLKATAPREAAPGLSSIVAARRDEIVAWLEAHADTPAVVARRTLCRRPGPRAALRPASYAQERFFFIQQLQPAGSQYNMPTALRMRGRVSTDAVERVLQQLVDRHEPLRTVFTDTQAQPGVWQRDHGDGRFVLSRADVRGLDEASQQRALDEAMSGNASRPFDLGQDLMLRGAVLQVSDEESVLLLCTHHIAADGWSFLVLEQEFVQLYRAEASGGGNPLPPLDVDYSDYVRWQRDWRDSPDFTRQLEFWRTRLAGAPPVHGLPTDRPRPELPSFRGATHDMPLDAQVYAGLRRIARAHNATLFMVLHAAFSLLLSRWSNSGDVVLGTPVMNRLEPALERLVGCFVNTLVLRLDCSRDQPFAALLAQAKTVSLDAQQHQDISFDQVVEHLNPVRRAGQSPLFQVMFSMGMPEFAEPERIDGIAMSPLVQDGTIAKFDLSLYATESVGGLWLCLEYATDLFDAATMASMGDQLRNLLADLVRRGAEAPLSTLSATPACEASASADEAECGVLQPDPADTTADCLPARIARQALATPSATAVVHGGERIDYATLEARADALAGWLVARGVGRDVRVGLCLPRAVDLVVAILAVWKAGGAYVPLDPLQPADRIARMRADAGTLLVLAHAETLPLAGAGAIPIDADGFRAQLAAQPDASLALAPDPGDLAYVIYTSGSTGTPKGVMVEHGSLVHLDAGLAPWLARAGAPSPRRWAWNASFAFDASLQALLQLGRGTALHVLDEPLRRDPEALLAYLVRHEVDVLDATPMQVDALLQEAEAKGAPLPVLVVGGEPIGTGLWRRIGAHYAGRPLGALNVYGPTETCVDATATLVDGDAPQIGDAMAGVSTLLLDLHGGIAVDGLPGELLLGGRGLARGYLGQPALTAERFVERDGRRWYRSGDLVRRRGDGRLDFLGRIDDQVKVRGYRIELGEIEHQLRQQHGVAAAAAALPGVDGQARLVGYVVATAGDGGEAWCQALRASLRDVLPEYMVPAAMVELDALPLTPNGKLDRQALPPPETSAAQGGGVPPATAGEQALAATWAGLFGIDAGLIGRDANFFALGGHSLLLVRLSSVLRSQGRAAVPLRELFDAADLAGMAALLDAADSDARPAVDRPRLVPVAAPRPALRPLSAAQERFWVIDAAGLGSPQYNVPVRYRISGHCDIDAVERVLQQLVDRHEPLRTVFTDTQAQPGVWQRDHGDGRFVLSRADVRGLDEASQQRALDEAMSGNASRPFDLGQDLMLRGAVLQVSDEESVLLLCTHHIAADGWSFLVLEQEFVQLYRAEASGGGNPLPPLDVDYSDYVRWQRDWRDSPDFTRQLEFWRTRLAGAPPVHGLPTDRPRPELPSFRGATHDMPLDAQVYAGLRRIARAHNATLFMVLHAAFSLLLSRWSNSGDVVLGTPVMNRLEPALERLVGCFVNTLVLRLDCSRDQPFAALLAQAKTVSLDAQQHQDISFDQVVEHLNPVRRAGQSPLFQVMFSMGMPEFAEPERIDGIAMSPLVQDGTIAKFDLSLYATESVGGLWLCLEYATDLFDAATMASMGDQLRNLLADLVRRGAEAPLSTLSATPACEASASADEAECGVLQPDPADTTADCLPARIARQALATPSATAVVHGGERIDYATLEARADALAGWLVARGVGRDVRVGLCLPRAVDLVVAILAVWKAGGAYVPLDPLQPADRIARMRADAGTLLVLAHAETLPLAGAGAIPIDADGFRAQLAAQPDASLALAPDPGDLAYVIYTSGSTGTPKGVMVEHGSLVHLDAGLAPWLARAGAPSPRRWAWNASFAFDASLQALLQLGRGTALHVLDEPLRRDPEALLAYLVRHEVDVLDATPMQVDALLQEAEAKGAPLPVLVVGGEPIGTGLWRRIGAHYAGRPLGALNVYGPTETCVDATATLVDGDAPQIGDAMAGVSTLLLDLHGGIAVDGLPGELLLGGRGLARGYLGQPALTAERFVERDGRRWYRSGDLVRRRGDGRLDFLGRIDDQVKVRGYRIELGEIEHQLRQQHGVAAAAAALPGVDGQARLVGYVVATAGDGGEAWCQALRASLRDVLPEYMVPAAMVELDALPLTPNGKLDRRALPPPETSRALGASPASALERLVANILGETLGLALRGMDDDFFDHGGHSIAAARALSRISRVLQVRIGLRDFFTDPTPAGVVRALRAPGDGTRLEAIANAYLEIAALSDADIAARLDEDAIV